MSAPVVSAPVVSPAPRVPVVALAVLGLALLARALGPLGTLGPLDLAHPTLAAALASHVFHLSRDHLLWAGVPALLSLAALEREAGSRRAAVVALASALAVSGAVLLLERGRLASYEGLSGVGHGFFAAWLALAPRRRWPLVLVLVLKLAHELATGALVWDPGLDLGGGVPVPWAHAAGSLAGPLALGLSAAVARSTSSTRAARSPGFSRVPGSTSVRRGSRSNQNCPELSPARLATASQTTVSAPSSGVRRIRFVSAWNRGSDDATAGVSAHPGCME